MNSQLVLFVCTHNKDRSQIANAFFNQLADPDTARSISAGLEPVAQVQAEVIEVMREVDVDLSAVSRRSSSSSNRPSRERLWRSQVAFADRVGDRGVCEVRLIVLLASHVKELATLPLVGESQARTVRETWLSFDNAHERL